MESERPFVTYKIKNERNGKFYVGSTSNTSSRWAEHRRAIKAARTARVGNHLMCLDIQKNGWGLSDFRFGIIERFETREAMLAGEQALLNTYWGTAKNYNSAHEVLRDTVLHKWFAWNLRTLEHRRYLSVEALSVDFRLGLKTLAGLIARDDVAPGDWVFEPFSRRRTVREVRQMMLVHGIPPPPQQDAASLARSISNLIYGPCKVRVRPSMDIKRASSMGSRRCPLANCRTRRPLKGNSGQSERPVSATSSRLDCFVRRNPGTPRQLVMFSEKPTPSLVCSFLHKEGQSTRKRT
ncbi:hypothetical protein WDL1P1_00286 (plasmid) [Variovorax sp. WDL1]|nr:hypothetical protein CHC06_05866 [Variovorax sp. B2]PNG51116.1 hypothetical protein CHC07_05772 [Variovorax sp. B4]VTV17311.1 hypothetical protein WDL1P1_00286 [Variovorax sp. WDL1]